MPIRRSTAFPVTRGRPSPHALEAAQSTKSCVYPGGAQRPRDHVAPPSRGVAAWRTSAAHVGESCRSMQYPAFGNDGRGDSYDGIVGGRRVAMFESGGPCELRNRPECDIVVLRRVDAAGRGWPAGSRSSRFKTSACRGLRRQSALPALSMGRVYLAKATTRPTMVQTSLATRCGSKGGVSVFNVQPKSSHE